MTIKVSSAKAKGRNLQQSVCKIISKFLDIPWGSEDEDLIQSRQMGQKGTDVILRGEALERLPLSIECKSTEKWALPDAIKQAKANQKKDTYWMVVMKKKEFKSPVICMDINDFFELLDRKIIC